MTSTVPVPAGAVTVRLVALITLTEVPAVAPKSTAVAPVKPVPLTVTECPPGRWSVVRGDTVTVGAGL